MSDSLHRVVALCLLAASGWLPVLAANPTLEAVPFDRVTLTDDFWQPRLERQRQVLVPVALDRTDEAVKYLQAAADVLAGKTLANPPAPHRFNISDLFKAMEGAAYLLQSKRDPQIEQRMDAIIDVIAASQKPDGYLYPAHIIGNGSAKDEMGDRPYSYEVHSHETYDVGHLYEAAVAYHTATGKRKLLDVAEKSARHINRVFFEGDPAYNDGKPVNQAPGHEEIELALVRLYEATGEKLYLEMARKFLEIRGVTYVPHGTGVMAPEYAQQHAPVLKQEAPVGHAVRATYLYSAMADVGRLENNPAYGQALDKIWHNMTDQLIHITGGLGAIHGTEGFGPPFVLPNADAYDETCAAVGNVFFNQRLFLNRGEGRFLDVAEIALFNNVLAGVNLEGNRFFYVNPLASDGVKPFNQGLPGRAEWFYTACCPTNLARLLPQVAGMIYATGGDDLYVAQYIGSETSLNLGGTQVAVKQATHYPFAGLVELGVSPAAAKEFTVRLRIPTWVGDRFMPGNLYRYAASPGGDEAKDFSLFVNGEKWSGEIDKGFAVIRRTWQPGDRIRLELPMPARFSTCDERVEADRNRVAVTRGPLVYCAEQTDNPAGVLNCFLPQIPALSAVGIAKQDLLGLARVASLTLPASQLQKAGKETAQIALKLIPYYAWNNRGAGQMEVWFPRTRELADAGANPEDLPFSAVRASFTCSRDCVQAIGDLKLPKNSHDDSIPRWTSWDQLGREQWIEADLKKSGPLRSVALYWYDDQGGVQIPASWGVETRTNGKWSPLKLYVTDQYQVARDQFNVVHPAAPVEVDAIRVKMQARPGTTVGILEMRVEKD